MNSLTSGEGIKILRHLFLIMSVAIVNLILYKYTLCPMKFIITITCSWIKF